MNAPQQDDSQPSADQTELFLRVSRRGLLAVLITILILGGSMLGMALWPSSVLASWPSRLPWLLPMVMIFAMIGLHAPLRGRGRRWDPRSPEVKAIMEDEFRRTNMARAQRAAFMVVLIAQVPLALLLMHLPAMQAVLAMAVATITLGMVILIALFLFFDRG